MKGIFIRRLAATAAWALACVGARAAVATEIDVSRLQVRLQALAPGVTAAVSFASAQGSTAASDGSFGIPSTVQHRAAASGEAFGQAITSTTDAPYAGGSAAIEGNVFGAGAFIRTTAYASSLVAQASGTGTIGLVNDASTASFTLAPWTAMTISASVRATASCTGASPFEVADSGVLMAIGDSQGAGPQFARVNFNAFALGAFGPMDDSESTLLSLVYVNDTDAAIFGMFSGYVASFASSDLVADAVPEPCPATLLLAGIMVVGATARPMKKAGMSRPGFVSPRLRREERGCQPSDVSVTASASCERSTSSTKAIGALSPLRKPIFRMRV